MIYLYSYIIIGIICAVVYMASLFKESIELQANIEFYTVEQKDPSKVKLARKELESIHWDSVFLFVVWPIILIGWAGAEANDRLKARKVSELKTKAELNELREVALRELKEEKQSFLSRHPEWPYIVISIIGTLVSLYFMVTMK